MLKEEKRSLKDKLEKVYEFMKQFVIGGINCPLCQGHFELV